MGPWDQRLIPFGNCSILLEFQVNDLSQCSSMLHEAENWAGRIKAFMVSVRGSVLAVTVYWFVRSYLHPNCCSAILSWRVLKHLGSVFMRKNFCYDEARSQEMVLIPGTALLQCFSSRKMLLIDWLLSRLHFIWMQMHKKKRKMYLFSK